MVIPPFDNNHEGYIFCHVLIGGLRPPNKYMAKYIALMVVIKEWDDHPKETRKA